MCFLRPWWLIILGDWDSGSESESDSALVLSATGPVSDFHSVSGSALESGSALASDSRAELDSESAPVFDSASGFQSESQAVSPEQLLQCQWQRECVEFVFLAQRVP